MKPAVHDWNGDGRPDLLVGDYVRLPPEPRELIKEEIARRDALRADLDRVRTDLAGFEEKNEARLDRAARNALDLPEDVPLPDLLGKLSPERCREYLRKRSVILTADPEYGKLLTERTRIARELERCLGSPVGHGFVRLFTRRD